MKLKTRTETVIDILDWDALVEETYGRPYSFQQQDGCKGRGSIRFTVPMEDDDYDYPNNTVPETVNHDEMGVSFKAWLARDPKEPLSDPKCKQGYCTELWWHRNFYPAFQMVANDLHAKRLLDAGDYTIDIDW